MTSYILKPDGGRFGTKWAYADSLDPVVQGPAQICHACGRPVSLLSWLPPHKIRLSSAKPEKWGDTLWGGTVFPFMVSSHFRSIYDSNELQGIEHFFPQAEILRIGTRKKGDTADVMPSYFLVSIPWGAAGVIDDFVSHTERNVNGCEICKGPIERTDGLFLKTDSRNGFDIFTPRGTYGMVFVSERFKAVMEKSKTWNSLFIPTEDYIYDEHNSPNWHQRSSR